MEIFPRLLYEQKAPRQLIFLFQRECKTNFLEREKKKHYLSKSHLQPASLLYISLFLRGKIQAILELVRQKRKSKLSFPNESQR